MQTLIRKTSFDSGHRVMNEKMKCFNIHGHTYIAEIEFAFDSIESIGYAIDFKEVKRVGLQWIDDILDHAFIANPHDQVMIESSTKLGSKVWLMSLNGFLEYCNPTAENISKELFLAMEILFMNYKGLQIHSIRLHETPNCSVMCWNDSISDIERKNFRDQNRHQLYDYAKQKGILNYDDRK